MQNNKIKVLFVDNSEMNREGFKKIVNEDDSLLFTGEAVDANDGLAKIKFLKPDVSVIDIGLGENMLTGIDLAKILLEQNIDTKIVILTGLNDEQYFLTAMEIGISGYVLKDDFASDVIEAIKRVYNNESFISRKMLKHLNNIYKKFKSKTGLESLTDRELEVLYWVSQLKSTKEISEMLFIESRTVDTHRQNISKELKLKGRNALLVFAMQNKNLIEEAFHTLRSTT